MPMMVATKRQQYAGKNINVGDKFHVSVHDVRLLKALDRVTDMTAVKAMTTETTPELIPPPIRHAVQESKPSPRVVEETQPVVEETKSETPPPKSILDSIVAPPVDEKEEESSMPESPPLSMSQNTEYSTMLRNRARNLGLRIDGRWSDERVQREIDEHNKKTYQRMDVRASE
jgi:hypothetical protein